MDFQLISAFYRGGPLPLSIPRPQLILAADCVYFEPAFPLLVQTLAELVPATRVKGEEDPEVLFCYKKRRKVNYESYQSSMPSAQTYRTAVRRTNDSSPSSKNISPGATYVHTSKHIPFFHPASRSIHSSHEYITHCHPVLLTFPFRIGQSHHRPNFHAGRPSVPTL